MTYRLFSRSVVLALLATLCWSSTTMAQSVTNVAGGQLFLSGTINGSYTNTHSSDNIYQSLTEVVNSRYSYLEHKWTFYVTGGTALTFYVEAYRPSNSDGDDFVFSYSQDGSTFSNMLTVTKSSDDNTPQTFTLPSSIMGTIFIRVQDTNHKNNKKSLDTLYVDRMAIVCVGAPPTPSDNLLTNPGFEEGAAYWWAYSPAIVTTTTAYVHSGSRAGYIHSRDQYWQGPVHDLLNIMANGYTYTNSAWIRLANAATANVSLTVKKTANGISTWTNIANATAYSNQWVQLVGAYTLEYTGTLSELNIYVEGPDAGVSFYIDDAAVVGSGSWEAEADARIESIRKRDVRIALYDCLGRPLTNAAVDIRQVKHDFAFGSALSYHVISNSQYRSFFTNHFEWAVFENETKWGWNEPEQTNFSYSDADTMYAFCSSNGIRMRGHCIFWEVQQYVQDWVQDLTNSSADLLAAVSNRLDAIVPRYADRFEQWDVNNEMLHGDFYSNHLGNTTRTWMFQRAQELDPDAKLFVNDYGVVSYSDTDKYVTHIRDLIDSGAPVGGVGAQCHMWEINPYLVLNRLNTLAELNLPIWCSEFDVAHPDEVERARLLKTFYKTAFSHPGVDGILMWGFWSSNHWRGADASIVNADWTTNAAGRMYEQLLDSWTTRTNKTTDANGVLSFRGFHGTYKLTIVAGTTTSVVQHLALPEGTGTNELILIAPSADTDADGMPDIWEQQQGLNTSSNDAAADADNDRLSNLDEYIACSSPTSGVSALALDIVPGIGPDQTILSFTAAGHRYYSLRFCDDSPTGSWSTVFSNLPGRNGMISVTNACTSERRFYRLGVRLP